MRHGKGIFAVAELTIAVLMATLLSACGTTPVEHTLLAEGDAKLAAEDYMGAISSYTAFASAHPEHPQITRARATQKALERLMAAQAALVRTQQGTDAGRKELADRQAENDRLRGEVAKLRADLERLRSIDLPARTK